MAKISPFRRQQLVAQMIQMHRRDADDLWHYVDDLARLLPQRAEKAEFEYISFLMWWDDDCPRSLTNREGIGARYAAFVDTMGTSLPSALPSWMTNDLIVRELSRWQPLTPMPMRPSDAVRSLNQWSRLQDALVGGAV